MKEFLVPTAQSVRLRSGVAVAATLAAQACGPTPQGQIPAVPPPAPIAVPGAGVEAVRLDGAEAARLASAIQSEISATLAPGLKLTLWAPEQLVEDPVALDVDSRGAVYATGSSRAGFLLDIRGHPDWTTEAHALKTVEDLRAFFHRRLAPEFSEKNAWLPDMNEDGSRDWRDLTVQTERLYRILDTDGDGLADFSQVVVEGFDTEVTDVAGGVLVHDGDIFLAAAPELWRLRDTNGDGVVDTRTAISEGWGVHPGFFGHGMSGVTMGPDGRIYWGVGDIGVNTVDREGRRWAFPNQGVIARANRDGSDFEIFATGLRNTHEFAFDEWGNLISVDNDGDHPGETERLVYITSGQDSGWRVNWQWGKYTDPANNDYKVWMDEGMFKPRFDGQAAWFTPPIAAYHSGPAGMIYNPGTALTERWRDHFFVSEYVGTPARSRVHAFQLRPAGAGFELARDTVVVHGVLATGIEAGPDGALYLADWIEGWGSKGSGRIWKLEAEAGTNAELRAQTAALLAADLDEYPSAQLRPLLAHPDMRVRLEAQFALAEREDVRTLLAAARAREPALARRHGIWGLGQVAREDSRAARQLIPLLRDAEPEIRAQAARVLGDVRYAAAADALLPLLGDPSPRARFFSAEALGRIGHAPAIDALVRMLAGNDDRDLFLRQAGVTALARIGQAAPLAALSTHPSRAVRVAAVVALRRMKDPSVAHFLADADEYVAAEAARAINDDGGIEGARAPLAALLDQPRFRSEPLLRRSVNANLRLGDAEAARRLVAFATRESAPEEMRVEALSALGVWPAPSVLDRVDGMYIGALQRDTSVAAAALLPRLDQLFGSDSPAVRAALAQAVGRLGIREAAPRLLARLREDSSPVVRVAALQALQRTGSAAEREEAARIALADPGAEVRRAALEGIGELGLEANRTAELLAGVLRGGTVEEQASALAALRGLGAGARTDRELATQLTLLESGKLPRELELDVAETVEAAGSPALRQRLEHYRERRGTDPMVAFADALLGGHAGRGRQIVLQSTSAQCTRCHSLGGAGAEVGPGLQGIGGRLTREQLLEALVAPSARIAPGYGNVTLTLRNGQTVAGRLLEETDDAVVVEAGQPRRVARADIARRVNAPSSMPPMQHLLTRRELRDVVEFLTTLK